MEVETRPDIGRASRADIVRMQGKVGTNTKETRAVISRLRSDAGDADAARQSQRNPLSHWQSRNSLELHGLSDADLEKIGVGTSVPGEFDLMDVAHEYGIHAGPRKRESRGDGNGGSNRESAVNPPGRNSLANRHLGSGGTTTTSWASSLFLDGNSAPEPIAIAAVTENLKLATKLRELERKCRQQEEDLAKHKDARRRAEEESTRIRRQLEDKLQEMTARVLSRDSISREKKDHANAEALNATTTVVVAPRASGAGSRLDGSSQHMTETLQRLTDELEEARAATEDERKRSNDLLYQLERLRCDTAQEIAASHEAAAASRGGISAKAEECRQLRKDLDNLRLSSEEAARVSALQVEEAEQRAGRAEARWRKVEDTLDAAKELIPSYRPADAMVSLLSAAQALQSNKDALDELAAKLKKAEEDAAAGRQQAVREKEGARQHVREAELRAEEFVQKAKDEMMDLRRDKERGEEAASSRQRLLLVENGQLEERLRRMQEKLDEASAVSAAVSEEKVMISKEAAREMSARAAESRDELVALRAAHQRQLEGLQADLAKEVAGRASASKRADEAEAAAAQHRASLESAKRKASMEEAQLQAALDEAVRELESTRSSSMQARAQAEERLARACVRAEAAEEELEACKQTVEASREAEEQARAELAQGRQLHAREVASKAHTIESLRDALAGSEEAVAEVRRVLAFTKEEAKNHQEALQREVDALKAARERAENEVRRVRDGAAVDAENLRKRVVLLESQLEDNRLSLSKYARDVSAADEEKARVMKQLEHLKREQGAAVESLTGQVAQLKADNGALRKMLDSKEVDFEHAEAALKRRVEALEHQRQHEGERTKRIEQERSRLEDALAHAHSRLTAVSEELGDCQRTKDAAQRQGKRAEEELAAVMKRANKLEEEARGERDALQAQLSLAEQNRVSHEKRLQMCIDEADAARQQAVGEAQTLRGEVSELKGLIEDLQREGKRSKEAIVRMEAQVEEAGGLRARAVEGSAELAAARQRVEEMRAEKVQMAAAHDRAQQQLKDKLNDEVLERERVESELEICAAKLQAERNTSDKTTKHAQAELHELRFKADLLQKLVDEKQMDLLEAERALAKAADKALSLQRDLELAANAQQSAARDAEDAVRARRLADDQLQIAHETRRDAEARAEALARINKETEKQLLAERERVDELEGKISAMEPQRAALDLALAEARDRERKLREAETSEGQLRRRLQETQQRLESVQEQRLADIKSHEILLQEAENEIQSVHAHRRSLASELDLLRADLSSVGLDYSPPPAASGGERASVGARRGVGSIVPAPGQRDSAGSGMGLPLSHTACRSMEAAPADASAREVAVNEKDSGGEGSGDDEELMHIGRLQKSRIETRLGAHGDPGQEFEELLSQDNPPDALRNTVLALVLLLGERPASYTPSWSEVRRLVPTRPWGAMREVQLHRDLGTSGQEKTKAAARSLALVLPAEAWAVSQSCGLIHEWINIVIDVRRLAADS